MGRACSHADACRGRDCILHKPSDLHGVQLDVGLQLPLPVAPFEGALCCAVIELERKRDMAACLGAVHPGIYFAETHFADFQPADFQLALDGGGVLGDPFVFFGWGGGRP